MTQFAAEVEPRLRATRVELHEAYHEEGPLVFSDPEQIRQVFSNLLENSLDAIKLAQAGSGRQSPGRIEVQVRIEGREVVLTWRDCGCGMSEEVLKQMISRIS